MRLDCLMTGVGGQGTVLASKLLAQTAIGEGEFAQTSETIGMAQRGGSVVSHVRIGSGCPSPMIPERAADVLIGFEPSETVRNLRFLKQGGVCIVAKQAVQPVTASLGGAAYDVEGILDYLKDTVGRVCVVDGQELVGRVGNPKTLNVVLLGAAAGLGCVGFGKDAFLRSIEKNMPERFWHANRMALELGYLYGSQHGRC